MHAGTFCTMSLLFLPHLSSSSKQAHIYAKERNIPKIHKRSSQFKPACVLCTMSPFGGKLSCRANSTPFGAFFVLSIDRIERK
ncbi:hypothetical protein BD289DRAFT_426827 [Coniella lustricola]|uniref:Secreted protein n=1 Tax=Coniella lustricola TaxID=2025994 RepID=A0A2T3AG23_9PEZI|nr:hypothetical protein BD289DRAFT_426827 [Coniella lustricola]